MAITPVSDLQTCIGRGQRGRLSVALCLKEDINFSYVRASEFWMFLTKFPLLTPKSHPHHTAVGTSRNNLAVFISFQKFRTPQ